MSEATARATIVLLGVLWGMNWIAVRTALDEYGPWTVRALALSIGAAALLVACVLTGRSLRIAPRDWPGVVLAGILNFAIFNVLLSFAQLATATSRSAIATFTMPLWAAAFAWLVLGERPGRVGTISLALGAAGIAVLVAPLFALGSFPVGILYSLGAAASWAAGTVFLKRWPIAGQPMSVTAWQLAIGGAAAAAGMLAFEGFAVGPLASVETLGMLYNGLLASALAFLLWFEVIKRLAAGIATLGTLLVPVVAVIGAMLILGERPSTADFLGFGLILLAAAGVLVPERVLLRPRPQPGPG